MTPCASSARASERLPFDPSRAFWRVNREMLVALAGSRAVLLELAHPLIAVGVAQHSDFRRNRFTRLFRTLHLMIACCFGPPDRAHGALRRMAERHRPVDGRLDRPSGLYSSRDRYSAADPRLRLWVWATLIDSTLAAHALLLRPLSSDEDESYYRDARTLARLFSIPERLIPPDYSAFQTYFAEMLASGELAVTETAREQARLLFAGPILGRAVRATSVLGISLLPDRIRADFGLEWTSASQRRAERWVRLCRLARRAFPTVLCVWPQATIAEFRVRNQIGAAAHPRGPQPFREKNQRSA